MRRSLAIVGGFTTVRFAEDVLFASVPASVEFTMTVLL